MAARLSSRWRILGMTLLLCAAIALADAVTVPIFRARAAEPEKAAGAAQAEPPADKDKETYGEYTFGPKTPTPLDQAVAELNETLEERRLTARRPPGMSAEEKHALRPVTVEEVVATIRRWDRTKHPISDENYRLFEQIAEKKILPPHARLQLNDQWLLRGDQQHHIVRIMVDAMTGRNQGYNFAVREEDVGHRFWHAPRPGYEWSTEPEGKHPGFGWLPTFTSDLICRDQHDPEALVINVQHDYDVVDVQIVAFDENGTPYDLERRALGAYDKFITISFRLDPARLPESKVRYVGVEAVRRRDVERMAKAARQRAEKRVVDVLPLPLVGRPYALLLEVDGKRIDSTAWRGKVVLVDFWSSSCVPCLKEMPALKELYARWHDKGLEVVGISFDTDPEQAQAVIDRMQFPWPSAAIAKDSAVDRLWQTRDQLTTLPTVLLIDQEGVLRSEMHSVAEVEEKLKELLPEAAAEKAPQ